MELNYFSQSLNIHKSLSVLTFLTVHFNFGKSVSNLVKTTVVKIWDLHRVNFKMEQVYLLKYIQNIDHIFDNYKELLTK